MLISAGRILTPTRAFAPGWVEVSGERITHVGAGAPPRESDYDFADRTLVPGYVDTHCHGGGGAPFTSTDLDVIAEGARIHLEHGTTTLFASLVTESPDRLLRSVSALADTVDDGVLAGIHLEGPWLSPGHKGAHDESSLRAPDPSEISALVSAGRGAVRMATLAPELDGGLDAIRQLVDLGVVAAIGHTGATYETTREAIDAGARVATHIMNAMPQVHHRAPGPVLALLCSEQVRIEVIADGVHLHPAIIRSLTRSAEGRTMLVTDAMQAAGFDDGHYRLGSLDVDVRDGIARLAGKETIAGSTLTMDRAVAYAVRQAGLALPEAVRAATLTPAQTHGLGEVGSLEPGKYADLVALDGDLAVRAVMRHGAWARRT